MKRCNVLTLAAATMLVLALLVDGASAQHKSVKDQLAGIWTLVSVDNVAADGTKRQNFGLNPKGILVLDGGGRYAQTQVRSDIPKFSGSRLQGTPEENKAAVQGTVATFGTWTLDEANSTITFRVEASMYPNQEGEDSKRGISLVRDELIVSNAGATAGGSGVSVWRRAK